MLIQVKFTLPGTKELPSDGDRELSGAGML